jgi:hypothetical protein
MDNKLGDNDRKRIGKEEQINNIGLMQVVCSVHYW